jgi:predicted ATPase/class 3 adenylate cyclase
VTQLPSGTVTFVFTDIEGSTRLLRRLGDRYPPLLERHRALLRGAWDASGGVEVKTEGDGSFVAFARAPDAVRGCLAAQRALTAEPWAVDAHPRVRMGVHTGLAFPHDGDYIALAVHQAARVVAAAHGGQIVVSEQTVDVLGELQLDELRLERLGRYRLRDFDEPVALFQADAVDLPLPFPALRAVPAERHNIVPAATAFVGRGSELTELASRLGPGAVVSIVGPGGVGKTRLAAELGPRVAADWPDGVWLVDLSAVVHGYQLVPTVAAALGVPAADGDLHVDVLNDVRSRCALLIFDNCEQIIAECATFVAEVRAAAAGVGLLATSREPLGLPGEEVHRLDPLVIQEDAVEMFLDRARAVTAGRDVPLEIEVVRRICTRVDGIPLAIELAASRCAFLSLGEIEAGLDERFRLLRSRERGRPARQRTLSALLAWSYDLLDADERAAFERLSLFAAPFDLASARAAVGDGRLEPDDAPDLVWSLAEKSLVIVEPGANGTRYRMLETIRAYASERLVETTDTTATAAILADWYLDRFPLAQRGSRTWLSGLVPERETMGALVDSGWLEPPVAHALARIAVEPDLVAGDFVTANAEIDHALDVVLAPTPGRARMLLLTASVLGDLGRSDEGLRRCDEADTVLAVAGETDRWGTVRLASPRALLLRRRGDEASLAQAEAFARAQVDAVGDSWERADVLVRLGLVLSYADSDEVVDRYREAASLAGRAGDHVLVAIVLNNLAETELRRGDPAEAARHQLESLRYAAELGMLHLAAYGLVAAARIAEGFDDDVLAVQLHARADALLAEIGIAMFPDDQALSDAMLERTASRLGGERYRLEQVAGEAMTIEEALARVDGLLVGLDPDRAAVRRA